MRTGHSRQRRQWRRGHPAPAAPISVNCAGCQKKLQVKATLAGKAIKCPGCAKVIKVPAATPPAADKDYVSGRAAAVDPDDPNIKDAPRAAALSGKAAPLYDPKQIPPAVREQVEAELTEGERILWVGKPEGSGHGRGLFGFLFGGAYRVEPRYTLYALTNRRVLLWFKWGRKGRPWNNTERA